ncbi:MAG: hypothetical protein ACLP56_14075 [Candidatus Sulfotelmatobacter sp.]
MSSNAATAFSVYLRNVLNKRKDSGLVWEKNWHGIGGETADVAAISLKGKDKRAKVIVEVERLREDPASNVVKIWSWMLKDRIPRNALFIHAFTKPYLGRKKASKERAALVATKGMLLQFGQARYEQVQLALNPRHGARGIGGASQRHAKKLASRITKLLK